MKKVCTLNKKYAKGGSFVLLEEMINSDIIDEGHPFYDQAKKALADNNTDEMCSIMDEMIEANLIDKDYPDYKAIKKAIKENSEKEFNAFLKDPNLKKEYAKYKKLPGADWSFRKYAKELFEYDKHADGGKIKKMAGGGKIIEPSRYDFKINNSDEVIGLYIEYPYKPNKKDILEDLSIVKSRFRQDSEYAKFSPAVAIVYPYSYGGTGGYKVNFSSDKKFDVDRLFYDERKGARYVFYLDNYNYKGVEVDIRPGSNKHYIVWDIKSDQKFANEKFKSIKEAEDFVKENKMVLVRKKLFVGGGFEELASPPESREEPEYELPYQLKNEWKKHVEENSNKWGEELEYDVDRRIAADDVAYDYYKNRLEDRFDLGEYVENAVEKMLESYAGGGKVSAHDISSKSVDDVAFLMEAADYDYELNDRETIMYFNESKLSAENKKKVSEMFGKMSGGGRIEDYYQVAKKSRVKNLSKIENGDNDPIGKSFTFKIDGKDASVYHNADSDTIVLDYDNDDDDISLNGFRNLVTIVNSKASTPYNKLLEEKMSGGGVVDSRLALLKKMDAKNPSATLKARIKLLEKMGKKEKLEIKSFDDYVKAITVVRLNTDNSKDFSEKVKSLYSDYIPKHFTEVRRKILKISDKEWMDVMKDPSFDGWKIMFENLGPKTTQAQELAKQIIFVAGLPSSKIGTNDDHTIRMTWPEYNLEITIDDESSPIAPGILIQYKTVNREYTLKKIKDAINDINDLKNPKRIAYYTLNEHDEGGDPEFVEDLAVVEDNGMLDNKDFIESLEAGIRKARGFSPDEKFSFDEVWWDDIKDGKEFTTTDEDEDERIWYLTPKAEKKKPEPKKPEEPKPDTNWKSLFANPERFQKYGGEFLYPPRAENKIRPVKAMFDRVDNNTYIAEPKMNGSATSVTIFENTVVVKERHNTFFSVPPTFDFQAMHRGKGAMCVVGEFMNKSKKSVDEKAFRGFCIWDLTAYEDLILVGSTIEERLKLIDKLYPTKGVIQSKEGTDLLYITEVPDIYKVATFDKGFEKLFNELSQIDMVEGFVLKRRNARLEMMTREDNNSSSMLKARKATANYEH